MPIVQTLHDYEFLSASYLDHRGGWLDHDERRLSFRALNAATFVAAPRAPRAQGRRLDRQLALRRRPARDRAASTPRSCPPSSSRRRGPAPATRIARGAVFVGRLHEEKGVRDVLALAGSLPSIEVSVAGHGPLEAEVAEAARRLPNLDFAGSLDRARRARAARAEPGSA